MAGCHVTETFLPISYGLGRCYRALLIHTVLFIHTQPEANGIWPIGRRFRAKPISLQLQYILVIDSVNYLIVIQPLHPMSTTKRL